MQPWQVMWGLAVVIFFLCKAVTWRDAGCPLNRRAWAYLLLWPGLDAQTFLDEKKVPAKSIGLEWIFATAKYALGILLFNYIANRFTDPYVQGWIGMVGLIFILHFGLFHILSCYWRDSGIEAEPLMNWPILATGLGDFWGKRWNTAFRNLTHKFLFRPLLKKFKNKFPLAIMTSFTFSGIIHDLVISLPAGGGYGGPTLFFMLQGMGVLLESKLRKQKWLAGWKGRMFVFAFLILPVPLLFHRPFVVNIIVPFMKACRALS